MSRTQARRLRIVGAGIKGHGQITLEGVEALRAAKRVLHLTGDSAQADLFLRSLGIVDGVSINDLYYNGALHGENYRRIVERVRQEVMAVDHVTLLLYGHPRLGVTVTHQLEDELAALGVALEVVPAPSSFDTMINDLRRDPLERGSIILDANRLLLFEFRLDPSLDLYIYHVSSIGCPRTNFSNPSTSNRIDLLQAYLLKFYPPEHEAIIISSAARVDATGSLLRTSIDRLTQFIVSLHYGSSLFIPGARPRKVNRDFLSFLNETARHRDQPA